MSTITVEDAKAHLNIITDDDNDLIAGKIAAAEEWIGLFVGKALSDFAPVPEPLKEAVRQLTGHLYENREASLVAVSAELLPLGLHDLMAPYREYVF